MGRSASAEELLRKAVERAAAEGLRELLSRYLVAEEVTGVVDEGEIARIDEELKEKAWEELRQKWELQLRAPRPQEPRA